MGRKGTQKSDRCEIKRRRLMVPHMGRDAANNMENHGKSDETHHRLHPRLLFETVERPQIPKEIIFDTPMALY